MSEGKSISNPGHDGERHEHVDGVMIPVTALAKSIARQGVSTAMTPATLEARRVIHEDFADVQPLDVFRELRTRLLLASEVRSPVILVSGIKPGCGASFVARNLAAAIALEEDRTALLIDCNPRHPTQDSTFELPQGPGLWDYLRSAQIRPDQIIYSTGVERLDVIPAGRVNRTAGDQLASLRMHALIVGLTGRYPDCCLIFDAPPVLGTPEARLLAERADLVVLVAGAGMHDPDEVLLASRAFDPDKLAGVVFNELP